MEEDIGVLRVGHIHPPDEGAVAPLALEHLGCGGTEGAPDNNGVAPLGEAQVVVVIIEVTALYRGCDVLDALDADHVLHEGAGGNPAHGPRLPLEIEHAVVGEVAHGGLDDGFASGQDPIPVQDEGAAVQKGGGRVHQLGRVGPLEHHVLEGVLEILGDGDEPHIGPVDRLDGLGVV